MERDIQLQIVDACTTNKPEKGCYQWAINLNKELDTYKPDFTDETRNAHHKQYELTKSIRGTAIVINGVKYVKYEEEIYDYNAYMYAKKLIPAEIISNDTTTKYNIVDVEGDGACFYRALYLSLNHIDMLDRYCRCLELVNVTSETSFVNAMKAKIVANMIDSEYISNMYDELKTKDKQTYKEIIAGWDTNVRMRLKVLPKTLDEFKTVLREEISKISCYATEIEISYIKSICDDVVNITVIVDNVKPSQTFNKNNVYLLNLGNYTTMLYYRYIKNDVFFIQLIICIMTTLNSIIETAINLTPKPKVDKTLPKLQFEDIQGILEKQMKEINDIVKGDDMYEIEIRLGMITHNNSRIGKYDSKCHGAVINDYNFVSDVSKDDFEMLFNTYKKNSTRTTSTNYIYNNKIRYNIETGKIQQKIKVYETNIHIPCSKYDIRISVAKEVELFNFDIPNHYVSCRKKDRISIQRPNSVIDITKVNENEPTSSYEVEIEITTNKHLIRNNYLMY